MENDNSHNGQNDQMNTNNASYFHDESQVLDFSDSATGDLLNNWTEYFKNKAGKSNNYTLLDGTDKEDPISTNMPLEEFYFEMMRFLQDEKENPDYIKIVKYTNLNKNDVNSDELYCIMKDGQPILASQSLFSILIELTSLKRETSDKVKTKLEIVNLK